MLIYGNDRKATIKQVGNKAANLASLKHIDDVNVPEWFSLTADCFNDFIYEFRDEYFQMLNEYSENKRKNFVKHLRNADFTNDVKVKIANAIKKHFKPDDLLAIRATATDDSDISNPFVGMFDTYIFVKQDQKIFDLIKKCYISCFSEQAMTFRFQHSINKRDIGAAVIIQKMINPDYSGVILTTNPKNNHTDETYIAITKGISHRDTAREHAYDNIIVDKHGLKTDLTKTKNRFDEATILKLYRIGQNIEKSRRPQLAQDIEFAIRDGEIYIIQTRPIAKYANIDKSKPRVVLDKTHISTDLKSITTPLTFSLAQKSYINIQNELLKKYHCDELTIIKASMDINKAMCFYENHIYLRLDRIKRIAQLYPINKPRKGIQKLAIFHNSSARKYELMQKQNDVFNQKMNKIIDPYMQISFDDFTNRQLLETSRDLEHDTLDILVDQIKKEVEYSACYDKLLEIALTEHIPNAEKIVNDIFSDKKEQSTAEKTEFESIIKAIKREPNLEYLFIRSSAAELQDKLEADSLLIFSKIKKYINDYSFHVDGSLKLETITAKENPMIILDLIKKRISNPTPNVTEIKPINLSKEILLKNLRGRKKAEVKSLLSTIKCLKTSHEALQLQEERIVAILRTIYLQIGKQFTVAGLLKNENDIFFLTQDEITETIERYKYSDYEIQDRVEQRKAEYHTNSHSPSRTQIHFFGSIKVENILIYRD